MDPWAGVLQGAVEYRLEMSQYLHLGAAPGVSDKCRMSFILHLSETAFQTPTPHIDVFPMN